LNYLVGFSVPLVSFSVAFTSTAGAGVAAAAGGSAGFDGSPALGVTGAVDPAAGVSATVVLDVSAFTMVSFVADGLVVLSDDISVDFVVDAVVSAASAGALQSTKPRERTNKKERIITSNAVPST